MAVLNEQQELASRPDCGVSLVLAGAGTGKTSTLVEKVKNLISSGAFTPEEILVMTFSRKAAGEIKNRIEAGTGSIPGSIQSGTFHSFCLGFLKEHKDRFTASLGFDRFPELADDMAGIEIYNGIIKRNLSSLKGIPVDVAYDLINRYNSLSSYTVNTLAGAGILSVLEDMKNKYLEIKKERCLMDFSDLIQFTITLLETDHVLRKKVNEMLKFLIIDEFQDTSDDNFQLLNLLLPDENRNLFAVGDDFQSIYGFRNARVDYIINFRKYFPGARIYKLNKNYRSRREIVKLSNRFIKKNRYRTRKHLVSFKGKGGSVVSCETPGEEDQPAYIKKILEKRQLAPGPAAVLCRNNRQVDYLHENLSEKYRQDNNIQILTMHASKGLEFKTVIIAGVSDRVIPDKSGDLEEERRLFYVAITRAEERLYILYQSDGKNQPRFIRELRIKRNQDKPII